MSFRARLRLAIALIAVALFAATVRLHSATPLAVQAQAVPDPYLEAASAVRRGDYATSRNALAPLVSKTGPEARQARLVLGFHAYQSGEFSEAIELLRLPARASDQLEDWRLFILAETAHAIADNAAAEDALSSLVRDFPGSPLRPLALQRAIEISRERESWQTALGWIELARGVPLQASRAGEIERLAWDVGKAVESPDMQAAAARRLLVEHPKIASELGVLALFEQPGAEIDWRQVLTPLELQRRARRLIDVKLPEDALSALDHVPESQRDLQWQLLYAEGLTRDRRGAAALELLARIEVQDPNRRAAVSWQRALAALDAAKVRRGRVNLPQSQRQQMRTLAQDHLQLVVRLTDDHDIRLDALRLLFAKLSDDDEAFDQAMGILRRLQELEPSDTTGTRHLWRLGWQAFTRRDYTVAIGYWSELRSLYPGTHSARSGWYWTARCYEALGHASRARDIYREIVAADTADFYSRHARSRLGSDSEPSARALAHPTEPWPEDPILNRARWLSDIGLDELALLELEDLRAVAERRAQCAVEAVALARSGRRRDSIQSLICAFDSLGRANQFSLPEDALILYYPLDFREIIERRATQLNLSPYLVFAMVRQESAFDATARSWAGARGLMQLMPATGREIAARIGLRYTTSSLSDPDFSVRLGTHYYRQILEMFNGNQELALAGYNGGPYRIKRLWRRAGSEPELDRFVEGLSLEETKTYVKRILLLESSYKRLYAQSG